MNKPILIVVSTWNRRDLTGITLDSIKRSKSSLSDVLIIDNASTEYGEEWLSRWFKTGVQPDPFNVGMMAQARLMVFTECNDHPYVLTLDNDLVLSPGFDVASLEAWHLMNRAGLCVFSPYRSCTQEVIGEEADGRLLRVNKINGCAQFMDRETASLLLQQMHGKWDHVWDWTMTKLLGSIVVPSRSMVQHMGIHGTGVNGVSPDVAVNFIGAAL